jgi:hypothetical protein
MRGKHITGARDREGLRKSYPRVLHVGTGAFEHGERRMAFVQMAHLRADIERTQQSPPHHAQNQFLFQTKFRAAAV